MNLVVRYNHEEEQRLPYARFFGEEMGATAVEYAIMVGLIAVIIVTAVATLGLAVQGLFGGFNTAWP